MTRLSIAGRIVLLAASLASPAIASAAQADTPSFANEVSKQNAIYNSKGQDRPDGYVIDRGLMSYVIALPTEFKDSLSKLGEKDRWLDIGAGEGHAVMDYATAKYDVVPALASRSGKRATAVAMSIEDRRTNQWYQTAAKLDGNQIQYLFGKRLRDYSSDELGRFQMITDVIGGFSYAQDLTAFLQKTLSLLDVNGTFYTVLQDVNWENGSNKPHYPGESFLTEIKKADGSSMRVCEYLKSIGCVQVTCEAKADWTPPIEVYRIKKTCDALSVPKLLPTQYTSGTPPERKYVLSDAPGEAVRASR
ncbi:MAG TPA: hypothetical protein VHP37_13925 [Burkholderiales bacterium]|nr:hypothetical protein [Burkholderiales bacterium]